ncbi:MAG TPA: ribonuclease Z [Planctomycetota bacterium]|nr:ribonuclease Z [Planctomycetota bacterium]
MTNAILCRWVVLGAGTIVPQPSRSPASHCLEIVAAGGRQAILFDLGPGALARAGDQGFGLEEIRHVVITHFHPDHCADLVALLFAWRLPRFASSEPPVLWGPKGIRQLVRNLAGAWGAWVEPGDRFRIEEVEPGSDLDIDGLRITPYSTLHTDHSLAYRIESPQGAVAAYTGDTGEGGDIVAAARDADLLVIECAVPDGEEVEGHLAPAAVARIASEARAKRVVLTHAYPEAAALDLAALVSTGFDGPVWVARDGWTFAWDSEERPFGPAR